MLRSLLLALRQLDDPALRAPLVKGALGAALALAGLVALSATGLTWLAAGRADWVTAIAPWVGGVAGVLIAWWLFLPITIAIAGAFAGDVAAAVERRHYPGLPPPKGATAAAQLAWSVSFGLKMLLLQLLLLPLLLIPIFGFALALILSSRLLGNGMFEGTAQYRMSVAEAKAARRRRTGEVWVLGMLLALIGLVPVLNLLVPVPGPAVTVHLLHRSASENREELRG